jgi:membrane protein implicated in regulation of membrane protease activity
MPQNIFSPSQLLIVAGLVLIALELLLGFQTGFDLVVIGSLLLISGLVGTISNSFTLALILSILLSILYIFFGRKLIKRKIIVMTHRTNIDKLIGGRGTVIRSITPDTPGLVRLEDEDWRATSDQIIYEKEKVEIVSLSGVTLKVKKVV